MNEMTDNRPQRHPGVFVLGMHRSGTSVVAGILDQLGVDGGPRDLMFEADQFNSDGYWEQRPLVAFHDQILRKYRGFASAPPEHLDRVARRATIEAGPQINELLDVFDKPWFLKDPRQCLLLPLWYAAVKQPVLSVVVNRQPREVVRSLRHRNGYSPELAIALWERYVRTLLHGLEGRPAYFLDYDDLLDDPETAIAELADVLAGLLGRQPSSDEVAGATALVRPRSQASSSTETPAIDEIPRGIDDLYAFARSLRGLHERFRCPPLPAASGVGHRQIVWRRRRLFLGSLILPTDIDRNARLDRRAASS